MTITWGGYSFLKPVKYDAEITDGSGIYAITVIVRYDDKNPDL